MSLELKLTPIGGTCSPLLSLAMTFSGALIPTDNIGGPNSLRDAIAPVVPLDLVTSILIILLFRFPEVADIFATPSAKAVTNPFPFWSDLTETTFGLSDV